MTTDESLKRLFRKRGWYLNAGIPEGTARAYKKRYMENKLGLETQIKILQACGFLVAREMEWEDQRSPERIRRKLEKMLISQKVFWSYDIDHNREIPDEALIENVLLHLDIDEIQLLFKIFDRKKIKNVWLERILIQEPLYHAQNRLYAFLFFGIKEPDRYIRNKAIKRLKQFQ